MHFKINVTCQLLLDHFEAVKKRIEEFRNDPVDLSLQKPANDTWSAADVCNQLVQFNTLYLDEIHKAASNPEISDTKKEMKLFRAGFF